MIGTESPLRRIKEALKKALLALFLLFEKLGVHITPVHYYSGLPNVSYLKRHPELWRRRSNLPGIASDLDVQVENLRRICLPFQEEYRGLSIYREAARNNGEPGYGEIESQALHGFTRFYKPRRVIQVGCGLATHCLLHALGLNRSTYELTCIEPYPNASLKKHQQLRLISKPVQSVSVELFETLSENDFLLIDSSHVVHAGSDVNFLVHEVLPRLKQKVVVSFHDITFPYDYPRNFLNAFLFPLENSLLRAYLTHNAHIEILACLSHLHYDKPEALKEAFPDYRPQADFEGLASGSLSGLHFPSSLWLQTKESAPR